MVNISFFFNGMFFCFKMWLWNGFSVILEPLYRLHKQEDWLFFYLGQQVCFQKSFSLSFSYSRKLKPSSVVRRSQRLVDVLVALGDIRRGWVPEGCFFCTHLLESGSNKRSKGWSCLISVEFIDSLEAHFMVRKPQYVKISEFSLMWGL